MKKLATALILLTSFYSAQACDICGGGLGNTYNGLLPNFNKRFMGLRYHFNQLYTQLDINGHKTALSNKEKYHTLEIWGGWNIKDKWRLMAIVPYSKILKNNYGINSETSKSGIGDINISGYYNLINTETLSTKHTIWVGLSTKLPSGEYLASEYIDSSAPNIYQLGTGSLDFIGNVNYDVLVNTVGINSNVNYKWNTPNKEEYKYGNKITLNTNVYYLTQVNANTSFRPNVGLQYEIQDQDNTYGYTVNQTGGTNLNANIGLEAQIKNVALGASYQIPLAQKISNYRTELIDKASMHITYVF